MLGRVAGSFSYQQKWCREPWLELCFDIHLFCHRAELARETEFQSFTKQTGKVIFSPFKTHLHCHRSLNKLEVDHAFRLSNGFVSWLQHVSVKNACAAFRPPRRAAAVLFGVPETSQQGLKKRARLAQTRRVDSTRRAALLFLPSRRARGGKADIGGCFLHSLKPSWKEKRHLFVIWKNG